MPHEQSNFQKPSPSKKKGLAPLGQLHKEGLVASRALILRPLISNPPQRQKDVAANELVQDLGLGRQTRADHLLPLERHRELPALPAHAPALHGTEAPRPEHFGSRLCRGSRASAASCWCARRSGWCRRRAGLATPWCSATWPRAAQAHLWPSTLPQSCHSTEKVDTILVYLKFPIKWNIIKNISSLFLGIFYLDKIFLQFSSILLQFMKY